MIKFKLLQLAEGAENLVAFAKSKAESLIAEFSDQLGFHRVWPMGEFTVRMQANRYTNTDDWVVRLWFMGASLSFYYATNVALPATCGRSLFVQSFNKGTPDAVPPVESFLVFPPSSTSSVPGGLYFTPAGTSCEFGCTTTIVTVTNGSPPAEYTVPPPSPHSRWTGTYTHVIVPPGGFSDVDIVGTWTDYLPAAQAAHAAAQQQYLNDLNSSAFGKTYRVVMSDGVVLLSQHAVYTNPYPGTEVGAPITLIWSGDGFVPLEGGGSLTFSVPEDARAPSLPDTPPAGVNVGQWQASRLAANVRERAWRKTCSELFLTTLSAGDFSALGLVVRIGHPISNKTFMSPLMTGSVVTSVIGGGPDITFGRVVTLQYTDANGDLQEEIINGTRRVRITQCFNFEGTAVRTYTTETFTNWLPIVASTGSTGTALDFTFLLDDRSGLAQVQNGTLITGAATLANTLDDRGEELTPPYVVSSDARTYSYPAIYLRYRNEVERQEGAAGDTRWLDSTLVDDEVVNVIPTYAVLNGENLGMFPTIRDTSAPNVLTALIDRVITFKYSYATGLWSFVRIKQGALTPVAGVPYNNTNLVFVSRDAEWESVKTAYADQNDRFKDEGSLSPSELFMKQVKKAAATL